MKHILILVLSLLLGGSSIHAQKAYFGEINDSVYSDLPEEVLEELKNLDARYTKVNTDTARFTVLSDAWWLLHRYGLGENINEILKRVALKSYSEDLKTPLDTLYISQHIAIKGNEAFAQSSRGDSRGAIASMKEGIKLAEKISDTFSIVAYYGNLASLSCNEEDYQGGVFFSKKAISYCENSSFEAELAETYSVITFAYYELDSLDKAFDYAFKTKAIAERYNKITDQVIACSNLALFYDIKGQIDSAFYYTDKAVLLAEQSDNLEVQYSAVLAKRNLLLEYKEDEQLEEVAEKALELTRTMNARYEVVSDLKVLSEVSAKLGKHEKAYQLLLERDSLKTELEQAEDLQAIADLKAELKYEKELEISALKEKNLQEESQLKSSIIWIVVIALVLITIALVFIGINRRKLAENRKDLIQLDKVNKQIFSVIAHDFKEPIISFNLLLNHIEKRKEVDGAFLQEMKGLISSSNQVLGNLLNWARAELEKQEVRQEKLNIRALWSKVLANMRKSLENKRLNIQNHIQDNFYLEADVVMLEIVFRNLLSNAIKFSPQGGTIHLNTTKNGGIEIRDEGDGVEEEIQQKLFQERVNSSYGTAGETGFGIGLYIVKNLLEKNDMTITYRTKQPQGASFCITKQD